MHFKDMVASDTIWIFFSESPEFFFFGITELQGINEKETFTFKWCKVELSDKASNHVAQIHVASGPNSLRDTL